jgi:outer membrane lipopolysaccharide assembly protein LptE/RlpB
MLVSWEIWKERTARVFRNLSSTANMLLAKIREEVALWGLAGAKELSNIMP